MARFAVAYARLFISRHPQGGKIFGMNVAIRDFSSQEEAERWGRRQAGSGEFGPSVMADEYYARAVEVPKETEEK